MREDVWIVLAEFSGETFHDTIDLLGFRWESKLGEHISEFSVKFLSNLPEPKIKFELCKINSIYVSMKSIHCIPGT